MNDTNKTKLNNLLFYGISYGEYDTQDVSADIITNIRMRFLVSQKPASNKLYRKSEGVTYVYSYNFSPNKPLQWKVLKNRRVSEEIEQLLSGKYCINYYDNAGKDLKKVFFDSKHRWFKTNYYNSVSNENLICSLVPKEFDTGTSILKYMTGAVYPQRLFACSIPSCDEVRDIVFEKVKKPECIGMTNVGVVYFMAEADMEEYEKVLFDVENEYIKKNAPQIYVSEQDIENGFNLSAENFDLNLNSDRKFDISLAEVFDGVSSDAEVKAKAEETVEDDFVSSDDGTILGAIADAVNKINAKTSLEINTDDILNFQLSDIPENNEESHDSEIFDFSDSDPSIDKKLRHIDSVLDESSLLTSERQLVIGDTVVDDDYISSIIDGIISSAFSNGESDFDEIADIDEEEISDMSAEDSEISADEDAKSDEEIIITDIIDDIPVHDPEPLMTIEFPETENEAKEETEDNSSEISESVASDDAAELYEDDLSETTDEILEDVANTEKSDTIDEAVESSEEDVFVVAPIKQYISDATPDSVINSRGESYFYYGDVDENGKRSGRGRTLMSDGNIAYEGGYHDDKRSGSGSFYFKDGSLCYWGDWQDNLRSGFGVGISSVDKAVHCGNWSDNKPQGVGARFDSEGNLMFLSTDVNDKKTGFTISELSDKSFTVCVWSEEDEAFVKRKITIDDILK